MSVIIPVFNSKRYLSACLESVYAAMSHHGNTELIILDNGSTDGSYDLLLSRYQDAARILQFRNLTIAGLRNSGAKVANGDYLAFIDSDCVVGRNFLTRALEIMDSNGADVVGCNVYGLPPHPHWIEKSWDEINRLPIDTFVPYLLTGNLVIKRSTFEAVGGLNEDLITGEDTEFGLRLNAAGLKVFASREVQAVHLGNPKSISEFFKKQVWHGLGMFGTVRLTMMDKPVVMTLFHFFASIAGALIILVGPWSLVTRVGGMLTLTVLAPAAAIVYRRLKLGKLINPAGAFILYHLYFDARCVALFKLAYRRSLGSRNQTIVQSVPDHRKR